VLKCFAVVIAKWEMGMLSYCINWSCCWAYLLQPPSLSGSKF